MRARSIATIAVVAVAAASCAKKSAEQATGEGEGAPTETATSDTAATATPPTRPEPPPLAPDLETDEPDAGLGPTASATADGTVLFAAQDEQPVPVTWTVGASEIVFRATTAGRRASGVDVQVVMSSSGNSQLVTICRDLSTEELGTVTVYAHSDTVAYVACTSRRDAIDEGRSWGVRLEWNADKGLLEPAGSFSSPGLTPSFDGVSEPDPTPPYDAE